MRLIRCKTGVLLGRGYCSEFNGVSVHTKTLSVVYPKIEHDINCWDILCIQILQQNDNSGMLSDHAKLQFLNYTSLGPCTQDY